MRKHLWAWFIAPYNLSWAKLKKQTDAAIKKKGVTPCTYKIAGFSAGGLKTMEAQGTDLERFELIAYIDGSIERRSQYSWTYPKIKYNNSIFSVGNSTGMRDIFGTDYDKFHALVKKSGGIFENIVKGHADYPKYFLNRM